ncbi:ATP-binding cassette domain-containing protein [Novosphingobium sp. ZN18A2]|uniref:ATP-binding cassette domain-containing protein n=1 Tax=Novosphingobium sp. ZN18A2 TaxID=3079861 RepID=UPI0030D3437F
MSGEVRNIPAAISALADGPETRARIRLAALAAAAGGISGVLLLAISGWFLTAAAVAGAAGPAVAAGFNYLIPSALIRLLAILRTVGRYGERVLSHRAALLAMADLRAGLFRRLAEQDTRTAPALSGGDASARLIGDIDALENLVVRRPLLAGSIASAIAGAALTLLAGWLAGLALAVLLATLPPVITRLSRRLAAPAAREAADALGALRSRFVELAAARTEIAAYGIVAQAAETLTPDIDRFRAARRTLVATEAKLGAVIALYGGVAVALVLMLADAGAALTALGALAAAGAAEAMAAFAQSNIKDAGAAESMGRLLALENADAPTVQPVVTEGNAALTLGTQLYPQGARVAVCGPSGSGKTMLLEQLAGERWASLPVALGGAALSALPASAIAAGFSLSPQDAPVVIGTVADNLRVARPHVDEAAMWRALELACLDVRVRALPGGLDTRIGEGGVALSGGERKRLSLARAVLAERPWLLLDEPTEGLDARTEAELVQRLSAWLDRTGTGLVIASHRAAPLALANRRIDVQALRESS